MILSTNEQRTCARPLARWHPPFFPESGCFSSGRLQSVPDCGVGLVTDPTRVLYTDRLILSALKIQDSSELFRIRGDSECMQFWDAPPDDDPAATADIVSLLLRDAAAATSIYWTARLSVGNQFIGLFDLSDIKNGVADLGFMTVRAWWGRGLAVEACASVIAEAKRLGLVRLRARIHDENVRSERLLRRLQFTQQGSAQLIEVRQGVTRRAINFALSLGD